MDYVGAGVLLHPTYVHLRHSGGGGVGVRLIQCNDACPYALWSLAVLRAATNNYNRYAGNYIFAQALASNVILLVSLIRPVFSGFL